MSAANSDTVKNEHNRGLAGGGNARGLEDIRMCCPCRHPVLVPTISHQSRVIDKGQHCAERSLAIANIMWLWSPVQNHLGTRPGGAHPRSQPQPRGSGSGREGGRGGLPPEREVQGV